MYRSTGFGCGCRDDLRVGAGRQERFADYRGGAGPAPSTQMGGLFEIALNVAGSFVGDPALGSQLASQAGPAFARIKETPDQIAARVAPNVKATLEAGTYPPQAALITPQSQQIANAVAATVAGQLAAEGVFFPPGTVGAELQNPSVFNAFGGENAQWVLIGGLALGALVVFKAL